MHLCSLLNFNSDIFEKRLEKRLEFRMRRAEKMLLHTDFSIEKIVETVGYTDKSRFYRNFKAMYCVSPVKYRKGRGELCQYPSN